MERMSGFTITTTIKESDNEAATAEQEIELAVNVKLRLPAQAKELPHKLLGHSQGTLRALSGHSQGTLSDPGSDWTADQAGIIAPNN
jgi:hypothetical protein